LVEAPVPDRPNITATRAHGFGFLAHADVLRALRKNFELPEPGGRFDNLVGANFAERPLPSGHQGARSMIGKITIEQKWHQQSEDAKTRQKNFPKGRSAKPS